MKLSSMLFMATTINPGDDTDVASGATLCHAAQGRPLALSPNGRAKAMAKAPQTKEAEVEG